MSLLTKLRHFFGAKPKNQGSKDQPVSPEVLKSATAPGKPLGLSGLEIMALRIGGSKSTVPTRRRIRMYLRKLDTPAHVGKKQQAKLAA